MTRPTEYIWRMLPAVRRHEHARTLFFTGLLTLVSAAQTVGLAGSEALFLANLTARRLPLAFVIASFVTVIGSMLYASRVGVSRNDTIFAWMLLGAGLVLASLPLWVGEPGPVVFFGLIAAFYLTQSVFTNHFWTFSGDYFDTTTSKRLFPVFTVGASIGGLLGGAAAAVTAHAAGPLATIAVWGVLLCAAAGMLRSARRPLRRWGPLEVEEADETSVEGMRGAVVYLRGSRLGRWLVLSSIGMVLALFVAQYIYSDLFVRAYPDPAELAVFIAVYLAITNLVEIALELWVTPWLIRRFGVASAHAVHPVLTLASFGALFAAPVLTTAIAARVSRELVENAVAQPVRTLVFNALPARLRGRIRAFLEGIVVYGGMSVAGLVLLAIATPDLRSLALLGGAAAALYLAANLGARRAYLTTLVEGIRSGRLDLADLDDDIGDWDAARLSDLCDELLRVDTAGPARSLLQLIPSLGGRGIVEPLLGGLGHQLPDVRVACARALAGRTEAAGALRAALADPEPTVRSAAYGALCDADAVTDADLEALLADPDPRLRAAAAARAPDAAERLAAMLRSDRRDERLAALAEAGADLAGELASFARDGDPALRATALARIAAVAPRFLDRDASEGALADPDPSVRCAALSLAVEGGASGDRIAALLGDASTQVRTAAAAALAAAGEAGAEAARRHLGDASESTAAAALSAVAESDHPRRDEWLTGELRRRVGLAWIGVVGTTLLSRDGAASARFLRLATSDALMRHRRLAFQTLEHLGSPRVVRRVDRALRFGTARGRGDALEVLSNLGDREAARQLVLLHEAGPLEDRVAALGAGVAVPADREALFANPEWSGDRWVRTALAAAECDLGETPSWELDLVERLLALQRVPLFANLNLEQLEAVGQLARDASFLPGEVMMREGDDGGELYLLLEGTAEAWIDYDGPRRQRLSTIAAGSHIGEMAILDEEPRSATVVAVEPARALVLAGDSLKTLALQMPEIAFELLRVMTGRVRASERRLRQSPG